MSSAKVSYVLPVRTVMNYALFFLGLFIAGLGVSLTAKSTLGTSPISSIPYLFNRYFPSMSCGQFIFLITCVFFIIERVIWGKGFPKIQYLQMAAAPLFGFFIDFGMTIFLFVKPDVYIEKFVFMIIAQFILALGVYLQVKANALVCPGEGLVKVIAMKLNKPFGNVKILFDILLALIAVVLAFVFFGHLEGVREGTVVSALLVGYLTKMWSKFFDFFIIGKISLPAFLMPAPLPVATKEA